MTPRNEMCCLDAEMDLSLMKTKAAAMQHRRLPIYSGSLDSIVGILNVRRFLVEPEADLIACIEPPAFVPETMSALELLKNFLRGSQRMAIVLDEFGGVEGLVTVEDLVEEIFGEIYDEYDEVLPIYQSLGSHQFLIRGTARLSAVSHLLKIDLEADGIDTLGGWLTDKIGAIPRVGDNYSFGGYKFHIEKMLRWRAETVLVHDERRKK